MLILYTVVEGGHWIPFNTPMPLGLLYDRIRNVFVFHASAIEGKCDSLRTMRSLDYGDHVCTRPWLERYTKSLFVPQDDSLPVFHSILTHENKRWDALSQEWYPWRRDEMFDQWFIEYIASWKPDEDYEERELQWYDQVHTGQELDLEKFLRNDTRLQKSPRR